MLATTQAIPIEEFIAEMEGLVAAKNCKDHPVILKIRDGALNEAQLRGFTKQCYIPFAGVADRTAAAIYARLPDHPVLEQSLLDNMLEEARGTVSGVAPHKVLFRRWASTIGITEDDLRGIEPLPEVHALLDWRHRLIHERSWVEVVAAQGFALEGQSPDRMDRIVEGLTQRYGYTAEQVEFWAIHGSWVEKEHGAVGPAVVREQATSVEMQARVRDAVRRTVDVCWLMFDGIHRAYVDRDPAYRRWWEAEGL